MLPDKNTYGVTYGMLPFGGLAYMEFWADDIDGVLQDAKEYARKVYRGYLEDQKKNYPNSGLREDFDRIWETWLPDIKKIEKLASKHKESR